jgi:hypothetical protein
VSAWELLPLLRELFSRNPEYTNREAWELQWILFSLCYVDVLVPEHVIEAARPVALTDRGGEAA